MKKNSKLQKCTYYIDGMHCASCEILIEKKLTDFEGVTSVDASLAKRKVELFTNKELDLKKINKEFEDLGYKFSSKQPKKKVTSLLSFKNGSLSVNSEKFKKIAQLLVVFISLIVAFVIFNELQLGRYVTVDSSSSLPAFALLGLAAGLSSCAALIGGLLLSLTKQWNEIYIAETSGIVKAQPHIMFHIGRIFSFIFFGGILGYVGNLITLDNTVIYSILTIIVSVIMLIMGLQMLEVPFFQRFKFAAPKSFSKFAANETNFSGKFMPLITGALTFFLPCGFTLIAQSIALTSGSFAQGALIMMFFALGTFPILAGISFSGVQFNRKPHLTAKFNFVAGLLVIFFVIYNINGQLNVLGLPSLNDVVISFSKSIESNDVVSTQDGIQTLNLVAKGFSYIPVGATTIRSGEPTKLVVDNQGMEGCGVFMASRGLINGYISLKPGINEIDLGEPISGTYKITCSMGMVPPVTIKVI